MLWLLSESSERVEPIRRCIGRGWVLDGEAVCRRDLLAGLRLIHERRRRKRRLVLGRAVPARQGGEGCRRRAAANEFLADMRDADVCLERLVGVMAGRTVSVEPGDDVEWRVDGPTI